MNELPRDELLSAYLDGELPPDQRADVERLLAEQPECRQLLEELRALGSGLRSLPRLKLEEDFCQRVLRRAERKMLLEPRPAGEPKPAGQEGAAVPPETADTAAASDRPSPDVSPSSQPSGAAETGRDDDPWRPPPWKQRIVKMLFWPVVAVSVALVLANMDRGGNQPADRDEKVVAVREEAGRFGGGPAPSASISALPRAGGQAEEKAPALQDRYGKVGGAGGGVAEVPAAVPRTRSMRKAGEGTAPGEQSGLPTEGPTNGAYAGSSREQSDLGSLVEDGFAYGFQPGDQPIEQTYEVASREAVEDLLRRHGIGLVDGGRELTDAIDEVRMLDEAPPLQADAQGVAGDSRAEAEPTAPAEQPVAATEEAAAPAKPADGVPALEERDEARPGVSDPQLASRAVETIRLWALERAAVRQQMAEVQGVKQQALQAEGAIAPEPPLAEDWVYIETTPEQLGLLLGDLESQPDVFFKLATEDKAKMSLAGEEGAGSGGLPYGGQLGSGIGGAAHPDQDKDSEEHRENATNEPEQARNEAFRRQSERRLRRPQQAPAPSVSGRETQNQPAAPGETLERLSDEEELLSVKRELAKQDGESRGLALRYYFESPADGDAASTATADTRRDEPPAGAPQPASAQPVPGPPAAPTPSEPAGAAGSVPTAAPSLPMREDTQDDAAQPAPVQTAPAPAATDASEAAQEGSSDTLLRLKTEGNSDQSRSRRVRALLVFRLRSPPVPPPTAAPPEQE